MAKTNKKATKKSVKKQAKSKQPRGLRRFYRETMGELRKVSWPTRREALSLTRVVVIVMVIMAAVLGSLDFLFFRVFGLIWNL
ncbi:MAG: preprotein translocase subunit SecE [Anaerolineales bacterium]